MAFISIDNQKFVYSQLPKLSLGNLSSYAQQTLGFCKDWLLGKQAFVLHTSGSTGEPKPIHLKRAQLLASAQMTNQFLNLNGKDHFLVGMDTQMVAGTMMLVRAMEANAAVTVVQATGNPLEAYDNIEVPASEALPTFTAMVPLQIQNVLESKFGLKTLQQMKAVLVGGGPIHISLEEKIQKLDCPTYHTYGMTETVSHIALRRINGKGRSENFTVLQGIEIKLDKNDCLKIKAPITNDAWLATNDRVALKEPNTFKWLGRIDNVINSGGIKIQAEQLERKIATYFDAKGEGNQFFVTGLPDKKLGEKVCLFMEGKAINKKALKENLKAFLDKYEAPKSIFVVERFPFTASGKIDKQRVIHHHSSD